MIGYFCSSFVVVNLEYDAYLLRSVAFEHLLVVTAALNRFQVISLFQAHLVLFSSLLVFIEKYAIDEELLIFQVLLMIPDKTLFLFSCSHSFLPNCNQSSILISQS